MPKPSLFLNASGAELFQYARKTVTVCELWVESCTGRGPLKVGTSNNRRAQSRLCANEYPADTELEQTTEAKY